MGEKLHFQWRPVDGPREGGSSEIAPGGPRGMVNEHARVWPFMAADLGMSRDTLMAHYMSNHIAVAYGDIFGEMVAGSQELGFGVRIISHAN